MTSESPTLLVVGAKPRLALMTAIAATDRKGAPMTGNGAENA